MKRTNPLKTAFRNVARVLILTCMITLLSPISGYAQDNKKSIKQRLSELDGVTSVEKIWLVPFISKFDERYIVTFSQPLDWEHPEKGSFPQRVEVSLKKGSDITAMDTEGYVLMDDYMMLAVADDLVVERRIRLLVECASRLRTFLVKIGKRGKGEEADSRISDSHGTLVLWLMLAGLRIPNNTGELFVVNLLPKLSIDTQAHPVRQFVMSVLN